MLVLDEQFQCEGELMYVDTTYLASLGGSLFAEWHHMKTRGESRIVVSELSLARLRCLIEATSKFSAIVVTSYVLHFSSIFLHLHLCYTFNSPSAYWSSPFVYCFNLFLFVHVWRTSLKVQWFVKQSSIAFMQITRVKGTEIYAHVLYASVYQQLVSCDSSSCSGIFIWGSI